MNTSKAWDAISEQFNANKSNIYSGAVEIIYSQWPVLLNYIHQNFPSPQNLRALDYGCGAGTFYNQLQSIGFNSYGLDTSEQMIALGKKNYNNAINLQVGDSQTALKIATKEKPFNLITSLMVFMFIEDIKNCLNDLNNSLVSGGHIIFSVFNPEHLKKKGTLNNYPIGGGQQTVPIFPRPAEEYDQIFKDLSFTKTFEQYITTDKNFFKNYPDRPYVDWPKYIVLTYQKN